MGIAAIRWIVHSLISLQSPKSPEKISASNPHSPSSKIDHYTRANPVFLAGACSSGSGNDSGGKRVRLGRFKVVQGGSTRPTSSPRGRWLNHIRKTFDEYRRSQARLRGSLATRFGLVEDVQANGDILTTKANPEDAKFKKLQALASNPQADLQTLAQAFLGFLGESVSLGFDQQIQLAELVDAFFQPLLKGGPLLEEVFPGTSPEQIADLYQDAQAGSFDIEEFMPLLQRLQRGENVSLQAVEKVFRPRDDSSSPRVGLKTEKFSAIPATKGVPEAKKLGIASPRPVRIPTEGMAFPARHPQSPTQLTYPAEVSLPPSSPQPGGHPVKAEELVVVRGSQDDKASSGADPLVPFPLIPLVMGNPVLAAFSHFSSLLGLQGASFMSSTTTVAFPGFVILPNETMNNLSGRKQDGVI